MGDGELQEFRRSWTLEIKERGVKKPAAPGGGEGGRGGGRRSGGCCKRPRSSGYPGDGDGEGARASGCQGDGEGARASGCQGDGPGGGGSEEERLEPAAGGPGGGEDGPAVGPGSDYLSIAESLLAGRTSPLRERIQAERCRRSGARARGRGRGRLGPRQDSPDTRRHRAPNHPENLLDQLINDLNEINEIPFFDIDLPYELALRIFADLGKTELGRCAQVSKTWKVIAEDQVLWYKICMKEGYHTKADISDFNCWKAVLRDSFKKEQTLRANWKNRIGAASQLQYDVGGILCDAHSYGGVVLAGYTSGDVRMWDISTWDSGSVYLETSHNPAESGRQPHISFVRINSAIAVAAYEDGVVDVWSTVLGQQPVHHYQHGQKIQAISVAPDSTIIATSSDYQVRIESCNEKGYWQTSAQFELQKLVSYLQLLPCDLNGDRNQPVLVAAAEDTVYLLKPTAEPTVLHSVYGNTVTSMDVSNNLTAFGVKSFGWIMSDGNKVQVYSLQTAQPLVTLGNSTGDFTCVNLRDSPPYLVVTGNKDRKVRVFDLRSSKAVISLYGHQLGVSSVQMDDWKIVSGGEEGLVCVWEQRMGTKLWEMHARHPVRHLRFGAHTLITANVPDEKSPRGASIMDDDLTAHRRHRGIIYVYDFSVDKAAPVLPICRSSYDEDVGYSYNIGLSMPYDQIK